MWWSVTLSLLLTLVVSLVLYVRRRYRYFEERGVRSRAPLPPFGTFWRSVFLRKHFLQDLRDNYDAFPDQKYVGAYEGFTPVVHIRDPEIIKRITVKDFDHFVDHKNVLTENLTDPTLTKALIFLKGQKWKDMRGTLSPAFTGAKMRLMVPFMEDTSKEIVNYLHEDVKPSEKGKVTDPKDLHDLFTRCSTDVIASCAFGFKVNSLQDKNNDFYSMGRVLTNFTNLRFILTTVFPKLGKLLGVKLFKPEVTGFFNSIISSTICNRTNNNIVRHDMIQLLMEAKNGTLKHTAAAKVDDRLGFATVEESKSTEGDMVKPKWTDQELASQAFLFFLAGFQTASNALIFTAHELALNPDIQERLYLELKNCSADHPQLTYEALQGLRYMDMVISESLRKWSGAFLIDRECRKEYVLEPPHPGGKPFVLKPGNSVYVPVNAIHHDPLHFPDPHKFDPERFSEERKHEIKPFTYLPFGSGPRNCIGSRFALMELKVILYRLVLDFELVPCEKTCSPMRLAIGRRIEMEGGSWIQFKPRN